MHLSANSGFRTGEKNNESIMTIRIKEIEHTTSKIGHPYG